jgi:hypothetical protein
MSSHNALITAKPIHILTGVVVNFSSNYLEAGGLVGVVLTTDYCVSLS